jgi:putative membrane protein
MAAAVGLFFTVSGRVYATDEDTLNSTDVKFVKEAGAAGASEVKLGQLGEQKASRSDVKEFAQMMIRDHTSANNELMALAKTKGVDLSAIVDTKTVNAFQALEKQGSGKEFDDAFLKQMEKDHKDAVSLFENEFKSAKDGAVKEFANKTLPILKSHLEQVQALRAK